MLRTKITAFIHTYIYIHNTYICIVLSVLLFECEGDFWLRVSHSVFRPARSTSMDTSLSFLFAFAFFSRYIIVHGTFRQVFFIYLSNGVQEHKSSYTNVTLRFAPLEICENKYLFSVSKNLNIHYFLKFFLVWIG